MTALSLLLFNLSCMTNLGGSASVNRRVHFFFSCFLLLVDIFGWKFKILHFFSILNFANVKKKNFKILNFQAEMSTRCQNKQKKRKKSKIGGNGG